MRRRETKINEKTLRKKKSMKNIEKEKINERKRKKNQWKNNHNKTK